MSNRSHTNPSAWPYALSYSISSVGWVTHKLRAIAFGPATLLRGGALRAGRHVEPPLPGPRWVRVRTRLGGICGSDLGLITLKNHPASLLRGFVSTPMGLGHENVAEICELGTEAQASWQLGERVLVEPTLGCAAREIEPPCTQCAGGRPGLCECFAEPGPLDVPPGVSTGYNSLTGGSWGPTFLAHETQLVRPHEWLRDEQLILVDPLACCLHAVLAAPPPAYSRVLVWGGGTIGLCTLAVLKAVASSLRVTAIVRHRHQAEFAERVGARVQVWPRGKKKLDRFRSLMADLAIPPATLRHGALGTLFFTGGYDVIYDAIGSTQTVTDSLKFARGGGRVVLLGTRDIGVVDLTPTWFSEVRLVGSYGRGYDVLDGDRLSSYAAVLRLLQGGRLVTDGLLTHVIPARHWRQALRTALKPSQHRAVKVALDWR